MWWSKQIFFFVYKKSEGRQSPALVQLLSDVIQQPKACLAVVLPASGHSLSPSCLSLMVLKQLLHALHNVQPTFKTERSGNTP